MTDRQKTKRVLNVPLVTATLVGVVVVGAGAFVWHSFQTRRAAAVFLVKARDFEEQERWEEAADSYFRYLRFRPEDAAAQVSLAQAFDRSAISMPRKERAIELYYEALLATSPDEDGDTWTRLCRRLADLLLEVGRFSEAEDRATDLLIFVWKGGLAAVMGSAPENPREALQALSRQKLIPIATKEPQGSRAWALARYRQHQSSKGSSTRRAGTSIAEQLVVGLEANPGDVELSFALAELLRESAEPLETGQLGPIQASDGTGETPKQLTKEERKEAADRIMDEMVGANPENGLAYFARYLYRYRYDLDGAEADLKEALDCEKDNLNFLVRAARYSVNRAKEAAAEKPSDEGSVALSESAVDLYQRAIEVAPPPIVPLLRLELGDAYFAQNEFDRAVNTWKAAWEEARANRQGPVTIKLDVRLAEVLILQGRLDHEDELVELTEGQKKNRLELLEDEIDQYGSWLSEAERHARRRTASLLRARWLIQNSRHREAIPLLKQVRAGPNISPEERRQVLQAEMLLAQSCDALKEPVEAEAAWERAVELRPSDLRPYLGLFAHCLSQQKTELAKETLRDAEMRVETPEAELAVTLAQAYERLGDWFQAEARYRKAHSLEPDNVPVVLRLADFLFRFNRTAEAEEVLRSIQAQSAETALAWVLANRGGQEAWQEAMELLDTAEADRRIKALLLWRRGGSEGQAEARQILEASVAEAPETADAERLLLARLYEEESQLHEIQGDLFEAEAGLKAAQQQYAVLVARDSPNPLHMAAYVDFLLRSERLEEREEEADKWLSRLEQHSPENLDVVRLRVRWLDAVGRAPEIDTRVQTAAEVLLSAAGEDPRRQARVFMGVGEIYATVDMHQQAEPWYRKLADLVPGVYQPLWQCLGSQGRLVDVIHEYEKVASSNQSPAPVIALAAILASSQPSEKDLELAEPLIAAALEKHPNDIALLFAVANLRVVQVRVNEAIRLYREILQEDPIHLLTLNNLATLLSEQPGGTKEALELINRAIEYDGEKPHFLDTKGTIFLHDGRPREAVPVLLAAASQASDPRYWLHLAVAYHRINKAVKATDALEEALRRGLMDKVLTPWEWQSSGELQKTQSYE